MKTKIEPLLYSRSETARLLGISQVHLWRIVKQGKLKPVHTGSRVLFSREELQRFAGVR
jgi:excisionase family DNA binding protein